MKFSQLCFEFPFHSQNHRVYTNSTRKKNEQLQLGILNIRKEKPEKKNQARQTKYSNIYFLITIRIIRQ